MSIEDYEDGTEEFGGALEGVAWAGTHKLDRGQLTARFTRKLYTAEASDLPSSPPPGYDEDDGEWVLDSDPVFSFVSREVVLTPELDVATTTEGVNSGSEDSTKLWNLTGTCRCYFQAETVGLERRWRVKEMPVSAYSETWAWVMVQGQGPANGELAEDVRCVGEIPMTTETSYRIGEFVLNE